MATYTDHYNLEKPAQTDIYNVDVFNDNMDIVDGALFGKSDLSNLAEIETSATASRSYAVGEYLVYNGILYRVTTAIAAGGTITPNSNVTAVNIGGQISEIGAKIKFVTSAASGVTAVLNIPGGCRCLLAVLGFGNINSLFAVFKGSGATPKVTKLGGGSSITMTAGANTITVANAETGNGMYIYGIALNGDLPTA